MKYLNKLRRILTTDTDNHQYNTEMELQHAKRLLKEADEEIIKLEYKLKIALQGLVDITICSSRDSASRAASEIIGKLK